MMEYFNIEIANKIVRLQSDKSIIKRTVLGDFKVYSNAYFTPYRIAEGK